MAEQAQRAGCVLIVDGDVLVRHALADYLRECGYTVIEGSSTDEAMTVLSEPTLAVDAVLCDAEAPGARNAFEFRAWAAEHRSGLRVTLAATIGTAAHKAAELCDEGPQLRRPYDPQSVAEYVRRLVGGSKLAAGRSA